MVGAGPAGLTAAYILAKNGASVTVLEGDPKYVGGIARTTEYKGFRFDMGGHRFYSKSKVVNELWAEFLPDGLLTRPRSSRIYYRGKFFSYPLKAMDALSKLGLWETFRCVFSYLLTKVFPVKNPTNFEDWVTNQFGKRLFQIFFKTYTEKVWGISCKEISADWAAFRIQGLSLGKAIWTAVAPRWIQGSRPKTLIESFIYPRLGPGMMWEACEVKIKEWGGKVLMGCTVNGYERDAQTGKWKVSYVDSHGKTLECTGDHVISSAPLSEMVGQVTPAFSSETIQSAGKLRHRDFLTVALIVKERNTFPDNWIYVHDPGVLLGRVQNYKSWSPEMVPVEGQACYGLEYFCFHGDGLWDSTDKELIARGTREMVQIGLIQAEDVLDGCVIRQRYAYPVYDATYATHVTRIRNELETSFAGLHMVGRAGMHKYNSQDHSMVTAKLAVENILAGELVHDLWQVDIDFGYEGQKAGQAPAGGGMRSVPIRATET